MIHTELPNDIFHIYIGNIHYFLSPICAVYNSDGPFRDGQSLRQEGDERGVGRSFHWGSSEMGLEHSRPILLPFQCIPATAWDDFDIDAHIVLTLMMVVLA